MMVEQSRKGEYMPAEQRREKVLDFKATHFKLGGGVVNEFPKSSNEVNYSPVKIAGGALRPAIDGQDSRRTNFILGNDRFAPATTSGDAYKGVRSPAASIPKADLRTAHFKLGTSENSFMTETQRQFCPKEAALSAKQALAQKELVGKIRNHHFHLGATKPNYLTMAKTAYTGSQGGGPYASKSSNKIGQEVRRAHFDLGQGPTPFVTTNQLNFTTKRGERASIQNLNTQETSIRFAGYGHRTLSCGQSHSRSQLQWPQKYQKAALSMETRKDLQGEQKNAKQPMVSENHGQFYEKRPLSVGGSASKNKMQSNNFTIGNKQQQGEAPVASTYQASISKKNFPLKSNSQGKIMLKTTLNIGQSGHVSYRTETKSNYVPHTLDAGNVDRKYLELVKGDHFPNQGKKGTYATENLSSFNFKGKASEIRSYLEVEKKRDLRNSHFVMGSQPHTFQTVNQSVYTPKPKICLATRTPLDLRKSAIRIGNNKGYYGTEQRDQFRWVQPTPAPRS